MAGHREGFHHLVCPRRWSRHHRPGQYHPCQRHPGPFSGPFHQRSSALLNRAITRNVSLAPNVPLRRRRGFMPPSFAFAHRTTNQKTITSEEPTRDCIQFWANKLRTQTTGTRSITELRVMRRRRYRRFSIFHFLLLRRLLLLPRLGPQRAQELLTGQGIDHVFL